MKIVGIAGRKRHGKDTAAAVLRIHFGYQTLRFADPLKQMLRDLYAMAGLTDMAIDRKIDGADKENPCPILRGATPRWAMQTLGTEWRDGLNPGRSHDLWSEIMRNRLLMTTPLAGNQLRAVIPDVRFPHEAAVIHELGGIIVRVRRPELLLESVDEHQSEKLVDTLPADYDITNLEIDVFKAEVYDTIKRHFHD